MAYNPNMRGPPQGYGGYGGFVKFVIHLVLGEFILCVFFLTHLFFVSFVLFRPPPGMMRGGPPPGYRGGPPGGFGGPPPGMGGGSWNGFVLLFII